jgi:uncharacterized protein YggE
MRVQPTVGKRIALTLGMRGGLLAAGPAAAQQPAGTAAPPAQRTIRVSGTGEAQARPDAARLVFAVETFAETARAAGQENARIMEQVIQALVAAGVPRTDIETSNHTVFPEYIHDEPRPRAAPPRIRGYRANNQVVLRTGQMERLGELIDRALSAGANRVDGVSFELREAEAVRAEATRRAVERARASAQTIAAALGVRLGPVLDASTGVSPLPPVPMPMMARGEMAQDIAVPTPIEPGEQTVRAQVTLIFAIQD